VRLLVTGQRLRRALLGTTLATVVVLGGCLIYLWTLLAV